jgi:hypothetical protein
MPAAPFEIEQIRPGLGLTGEVLASGMQEPQVHFQHKEGRKGQRKESCRNIPREVNQLKMLLPP